ncbi:MAG: hypothetical protein LBV32_09615 [Tannerellaceae bacterium]|jgi:membrane protein implicated in regulation of membrane protease activity|nr:hypothetical protein [Tannerellaceae bacterium]
MAPVSVSSFAFTVTVQLAVFSPSAAMAVMVVVPAAMGVTSPEDETSQYFRYRFSTK